MHATLLTVVWLAWIAITAVAAGHVVLRKSSTRAAIGWVALLVAWPGIGVLVYWVFGINRVERRASRLRRIEQVVRQPGRPERRDDAELVAELGEALGHLLPLARSTGRLVGRRLATGCRVTPFEGGVEAYDAMIGAIDEARVSVGLVSYIFDTDSVGERFVDALARAVGRGVEVRVLVDGVGALYSQPTIARRLRQRGIPHARFLWSWLPWRTAYLNLRNHRKILVCDGIVAFTGGMNIRHGYLREGPARRHHIQDVHFMMEGPVVPQLTEVFATDWNFCTGEALDDATWFPEVPDAGEALTRVVPDGPDEDLDKIRLTLLSALALARERVRIVTPYFLPDRALLMALITASLRGVEVEVLLPLRSNLPYLAWATTFRMPVLLRRGVKVWRTAPPFDHTKLMVVDDRWVFLGSANWDDRSLRLNFEMNVEVYDHALAARCHAIVDERLKGAEPLTLAEVEGRPLWVQLRDGLARLGEPYL